MANDKIIFDIEGRNKLKKSLKDNITLTDKLESKLGEVGKIAGGVALGSLVAGGIEGALRGITAELGESVTRLREFSKATAEVNSILPANEKLTNKSLDAFRGLAAEYATSPTRQAKAFYDIVSAGIEGTAKQLEVLNASNQAAVAGLVDVQTAADVTTSVLNAYASEGITATEATDSLFTAVRLGKTTFNELSSSVGRVTALASSAGVSFDELSGTLAFVTKNGISTDEAVTGLRALLTSVVKPSQEAAKFARQLGIDFSTTAIKSKGFAEFLREISVATKGSETQLAKLFPNVRALGPILQIAKGDFSEFTGILDQFNVKAGATEKAAEIIKDSLDFQLERVSKGFDGLIDRLTSSLEPALKASAELLGDLLQQDPDTIESVGVEIEKLSESARVLNQRLEEINSGGLAAEVFDLEDTQKQLTDVNGEIAKLIAQRDQLAGGSQPLLIFPEAGKTDELGFNPVTPQVSDEELNKRQELNNKIVEAEKAKFQTLSELSGEFNLQKEEQNLLDQENELLGIDNRIEVIQEALGREQALRTANQAKKLADEKKFAEASLVIEKQKQKALEKLDKQQVQLDLKNQQARVNIASATANLIGAASKDGSKIAFVAQKAAAIAQAVVATNLASVQALAVPPAPNVGLAALAKTAGAINIAAIAATAIKGFEDGGIIPGVASGPGDNTVIAARSGELVLTEAMQDNLATKLKSGGDQSQVISAINGLSNAIENQNIVIEVDSKEIARATRQGQIDGVQLL